MVSLRSSVSAASASPPLFSVLTHDVPPSHNPGAKVDETALMVVALSTELSYFAARDGVAVPRPKSCSDFHVLHDGTSLWGHNEDETPDQAAISYLVRGNVSGDVWLGFTYAPNVVGWAWGANLHGHGQSVNALFPINVSIGLGTNFVARDVLRSTSLDDAVKRATVKGQGNGQHFNLGNTRTPLHQAMVETSFVGSHVRSDAELSPVAFHANLFESPALKGLDGGPSLRISSAHRMRRMAELAPKFNTTVGTSSNSISITTDIFGTVLSDRKDPAWPIHRNGASPDCCITLNSVVFDAVARTITVWGPTGGAAPMYVVDWDTLDLSKK